MDIIRQVGKSLRKTKEQSDFAIQRVKRNFPIIEKVFDYITVNHPFKAEFKTYYDIDQVYLTIEVKPDIVGVVVRPVCNADTDIGFDNPSGPDIWNNIQGNPIGDPGTFIWGGITPSHSSVPFGSDYPPILTDGEGGPYRPVNGNTTWGVGSKVYLQPGSHGADFNIFLNKPTHICKILFTNGFLFGFSGSGNWSLYADGNLILSGVVPGVVYEMFIEAQVWTVRYYSTHSQEGFVFIPGQDVRAIMLFASEWE